MALAKPLGGSLVILGLSTGSVSRATERRTVQPIVRTLLEAIGSETKQRPARRGGPLPRNSRFARTPVAVPLSYLTPFVATLKAAVTS